MSPTGIFNYFTAAERAALRQSAIGRLANGERTSLSGGGKSGSKAWQMSPQDVLFELAYSAMILGETPARAQKVVQVLSPQFPLTNYPDTLAIP